jgi:hypothetical protein
MTAKETLVKAPEVRVRRNPVEGRNRLKIRGTDPDFEYRVVNDLDDRINEFLDAGWVFETSEDIRVGDSRIDDHSKLGKVRVINVGGGIKAYLMKIRKDWYDEDQKAKQDHVDRTEAAMRPDQLNGQYGKVELTRK